MKIVISMTDGEWLGLAILIFEVTLCLMLLSSVIAGV